MEDGSSSSNGERLIFVSAAEQSADLHGANLIRAVQSADPGVRFIGVAGPMMREAGCEAIDDMTAHAAMAGGIIKVVPKALSVLRNCKRCLHEKPVDLCLVIDSPTLNLPVAKHAKAAGVPVFYFIAPQVWAWAERRVKRVRARVDKMAVILPFEEKFFRDYGLDADYVGHPLFDVLENRKLDHEKLAAIKAKGQPIVSILPGSRAHVTQEVFPGQVEVAKAITERFPKAHFCISVANGRTGPIIEGMLTGSDLSYSLHDNENGEILTAADLALVASGTSTLETAYYHTPMIVMYNGSRLGYHLVARWLISTKQLALINIIAGREMVPEFMPYYRSTKPIAEKAIELLSDDKLRVEMRKDIAQTISPLIKTGAVKNAADVLLNTLNSYSLAR
ncbi:MAG: lipid-A-disaccharide synthase 1 [Phycisphaerae bacterium]|nr:MAG: lipid-A-disaccharide synthase 1 [Phycisphaerae bacterium]